MREEVDSLRITEGSIVELQLQTTIQRLACRFGRIKCQKEMNKLDKLETPRTVREYGVSVKYL